MPYNSTERHCNYSSSCKNYLVFCEPPKIEPSAVLCAGVGLLVALTQPIHRNMGIDLRCGQAAVTEDFLNGPQVRTAVEEVRRSAVPNGVRARRRGVAECGEQLLDRSAHRALVDPAATPT